MTGQKYDDKAWLELMLELDSDGQPAPELLVRYAREPGALPAAERSALEARIAASPALADELRVLRGVDWARLRDAEPVPAPKPRPRRRLRLWIPALALASLAVVAVYPLLRPTSQPPRLAEQTPAPLPPGTDRPPPTQLTEREAGSGPAAGSEMAQPGPGPADAPAGPSTRLAQAEPLADPPAASDPGASAPAADAGRDPTPGPTPAPAPPAEPRPPLPADSGRAPAGARPGSRPAAEPPTPAPAPAPAPATIMLAMVEPAYVPAAGADAGSGTLVRGAGEPLRLRAAAPQHLALTASPQPRLHWFLATSPPSALLVLIEREDDGELLAERELAGGSAPGWRTLDLATLDLALPPNVPVYWSVTLLSADGATAPPTSGGRIRLTPPPAALREQLAAATDAERAALWAGAGYWYDALDGALALRRAHPDNASVSAGLRALLDQGGLEALPLP